MTVGLSHEANGLAWLWGEGRTLAIELVGLALSILVTANVLLNKRDVGSSIGWIGIAWLSPIIGTAIYFLFGVNRVERRARKTRPVRKASGGDPASPRVRIPEHLVALDRASRRISGNAAEGGNHVRRLRSGAEAYPAMLDVIAGATASIGLSTYIMQNDDVGARFVDALAAARARGVEVRVVLDGIGSGYFLPAMYGRLCSHGIPVGRFMHSPLPWRMPFLNLRTHKKLLVVDGCTAFTGGMNIGDENLPRGRRLPLVLDTHFAVTGPVARQMGEAFARDWFFVSGEELDAAAWFRPVAESGDATARVVSSGPDEDLEKIALVLLQAIGAANRSVHIMTPYFVPSEDIVTALALAALRGVAVDIVLPERSNHAYVDWATWAHIGPLVRHGVRVWRNRPPFDHSKLMTIDGDWCFVGSANLDMRSLRLNFEMNVEIYDRPLAAELDGFMAERHHRPITLADLHGRSVPVRLRDAAVRLASPYL